MPTFTSYGTEYLVSQTPWPYTRERNRDWYEPFMMEPFVRQTMWYNLVRYMINMEAVHSETAHFTQRIQPPANPEELDFRGLTLPRQYYDSRNFSVDYKSYGGSVMYHKYDKMIYQWAKRNQSNPSISNTGIPQPDLESIIRSDLAVNLTQTLDILARNAFITGSALNRSFASDATGFHDIAAGDTFDPEIAKLVKLNAAYQPNEPSGIFPAAISPAAEYSLVDQPATTNYMNYRASVQDASILNYFAAEYMGVTYLRNWRLVLWNVGEVLAQASITVAVEPGDGSPAPATLVDEFWATGSDDATHYIQLSNITDPTTTELGFLVGDIVTLHRARNSADGALCTDAGVQWDHAANIDARVVAVDYSLNRISLEFPVLNENYYVAIATGFYGWVTKARPVHVAIFFQNGMSDPGVAGVVMDAPKFYINPPIDVRKARWEFGWDTYMAYNVINPEAFVCHFHAGPIVRKNTAGGLELVNL